MKTGFTLIEVMLGLLIVGVLSVTVASLFTVSMKVTDDSLDKMEMLGDLQTGVERLLSELPQAERLVEADVSAVGFTLRCGVVVGTNEGVFLLEDGAGAWRNINGTPPNNIPSGVTVYSLLCEDDGRIIAGCDDGNIYISLDMGANWAAVSVGVANEVRSIIRASNGRLYAGTYPAAVYYSDDDGASWTQTAPLPGSPTRVYSLLEDSSGAIYAATDWDGEYNLYRSTDRGASWTPFSVCYIPPGIWMYRKPITITNNTSQNLTDYQVRIVVPFEVGKMRSDYGDLRFRASDGVTDLDYWIEFYDSSSAIVWVKIPFIRRRGRVRIYMYYGNPSATTTSSITNTMEPTYIRNSVPYQWTNRVSTTSVASGDDVGTWVDFSFAFPYWREYPRTRAYACSNGYLSLHTTATYGNDWSNSSWELRSRWLVAPFWDDLRTDRAGRRLSRNPGLYVDSYADRIMFDWEVTHYRSNRWEIKFQAILYRNGDIRVNIDGARFFNSFTPTLGVSLGDGSNYIDFTGERASRRSWLFTIRKFVSPEPTVSIGAEELLYTATTHIYSLTKSDKGLLCAGTGPNGYLFLSVDGVSWQRTAAVFAATEVYSVFAEGMSGILAGTAPNAGIYISTDGGGSWNLLQSVAGSDEVRAFTEDEFEHLYGAASSNAAVLLASAFGSSFGALPNLNTNSAYSVGIAYKRIRYFWAGAGTQLQRSERGSTENLGGELLSDFSFAYFDKNFNAITPLPLGQNERDGVETIKVSYTISKDGESIDFTTTVSLRNN